MRIRLLWAQIAGPEINRLSKKKEIALVIFGVVYTSRKDTHFGIKVKNGSLRTLGKN